MALLSLVRDRLPEVLRAIAPLVGLGIVLQMTIVHAPAALFVQVMVGSILFVLLLGWLLQ
ncbi:MAG: hypothetical protein ABS84_17420 [Rubrivivax sp. SCN 71-131]|jgi:hypothetical protein|nr:MAG: hypothetical protein ABS84_17420 [Rubrivivax sp. SCN 71-131]